MKAGAAVGVFVGFLVLAGGVGWLLYEVGKSDDAASGDPSRAASSRRGGKSSRVEVERAPPPAVFHPKPPERPNARFPVPGHEDLNRRNWREIAIVYAEMSKIHAAILRDGPPNPDDPKSAALLEKQNELIQKFQAYLVETPDGFGVPAPGQPPPTKLPEITPTGHPAFVVNLVGALLDRAGLALSDDQARRLLDVAVKHSEVADRPAPPTSPDDFALVRIGDKAQEADAFFGDLFGVLTYQQAETIAPSATRDHAGMVPLSSALAWSQVLRAMPFTDVDKLVDEITDCLAGSFNMMDRSDEIRPIVDKWARAQGFDAGDADEIEHGAVRTFRGPGAVKSNLELLHAVLDGLKTPPPDPGRIRGVPIAFVPLRK